MRRHRAAVAIAAAFCTVVTIALVVSVNLWRQATIDRDSARNAEGNEREARVAETAARLAEQKQREDAEFQSYVANVAAADRAIRAHDIVEARQRLDRAPERLRNWEWLHLNQRIDSSRLTLPGHSSYVYSVAFSPDGLWLASADWGGIIRIWNARSGSLLHELQAGFPLTTIQISADGQRIAAAGKGPAVKIWNTSNRNLESELVGPTAEIRGISFSHDGRRIACTHAKVNPAGSTEDQVIVWEIASRNAANTLPSTGNFHLVVLAPDSDTVAVTGPRKIEVWNLSMGKLLHTISGQNAAVNALAFSPDGSQVVSGWNDDLIRIFDTQSGSERGRLSGHTGPVTSVAFSHDGSRVVSGSRDKTIRIWNAANGQPSATLCGHTWTVTSVAFSPDDRSIASASWDKTVKLWSATELDELPTLRGHQLHASGVAVSADGTLIASSSWDKSVRLWDAKSLKQLAVISGHDGPVQCVAFNPDRSATHRLASGSWDQTIRLCNPDSPNDFRILKGHTDRVQGLAFSPNGKWLVSGSRRTNTIRFWDASTGEPAGSLVGHTDHIHCVAFSPNGQLLASSGHQTIKIWDVEKRVQLASLPRTIVQEATRWHLTQTDIIWRQVLTCGCFSCGI